MAAGGGVDVLSQVLWSCGPEANLVNSSSSSNNNKMDKPAGGPGQEVLNALLPVNECSFVRTPTIFAKTPGLSSATSAPPEPPDAPSPVATSLLHLAIPRRVPAPYVLFTWDPQRTRRHCLAPREEDAVTPISPKG
jgi:hypothetical protein